MRKGIWAKATQRTISMLLVFPCLMRLFPGGANVFLEFICSIAWHIKDRCTSSWLENFSKMLNMGVQKPSMAKKGAKIFGQNV